VNMTGLGSRVASGLGPVPPANGRMKGTPVSGIDHSGLTPEVTCTPLNSLLRRRVLVGDGPAYPKYH